MALISDTDYLIHSIRLNYLREVEDPYGPRLISLDPGVSSNAYINAAGLSDPERWPELERSVSPQLSDEDETKGERPTGFPGARLKHSQTIMGGRTGGLGMRVSAKRQSTSKRMSLSGKRQSDLKNFLPGKGSALSATVTDDTVLAKADPDAPDSPVVLGNGTEQAEKQSDGDDESTTPVPEIAVQVQQATAPEEAPVQKVVPFIPKFRGAAEMERRRKLRMAARTRPGGSPAQPPPQNLSFDSSSESSESEDDELSPDSDFLPDDASADVDEFDPEFAATRTSDTVDENSTSASASGLSVNSSSASWNVVGARPRGASGASGPRLSPVSEKPVGGTFEMVTPPIATDGSAPGSGKENGQQTTTYFPPRKLDNTAVSQPQNTRSRNPSQSSINAPPVPPTLTEPAISFTRRPIPQMMPMKSALTAMLAQSGSGNNPFAETYAAISGRGTSLASGGSMQVRVFFPHAKVPGGEALELNVRKDATVEEALGFALWSYWEEGWSPRLDEGLPAEGEGGEEGEHARRVRLSAIGWIMRIAEEDGEVDDDFPPPDRAAKASKFNSDAFAVLEANATQIAQNRKLEAQIQRHPSRSTNSNNPRKLLTPSSAAPAPAERSAANLTIPSSSIVAGPQSSSNPFGSYAGPAPISSSLGLGPSSSHGPQLFLRIRIEDMADTAHFMTTIEVSAAMYMQEALELVCKKRRLPNPNDWALLSADKSIRIPPDRTVASLEGNRELVLIKKSMLPTLLESGEVRDVGRATDPNASIFKRLSEYGAGEGGGKGERNSVIDPLVAYKKFTVTRKVPMLVTGRERTLAIDGVYVHIMPSANKARAVFDPKTDSFHIKSVVDCQQSGKSAAFKIVVNRANGGKRRDFEAETPKAAAEIVSTITSIKKSLDRSSTVKHSRRSKHVA